jgi:hypothetical protein
MPVMQPPVAKGRIALVYEPRLRALSVQEGVQCCASGGREMTTPRVIEIPPAECRIRRGSERFRLVRGGIAVPLSERAHAWQAQHADECPLCRAEMERRDAEA